MSLETVKAWFDQAERDAEFARYCHRGGYYTESVVAAEQAFDKRLKALVLAAGGRIDSTHQIHRLYALLVEWNVLADDERIRDDARQLFKEYQVSRYPMGESPEAPYRLGSRQRAEWALDAVARLWSSSSPALRELGVGHQDESNR